MGTGGGEYLDSFDFLPIKTYATEGYKPNLEIAQSRLLKRNIEVRYFEDNIIPFDDNNFNLVINRHDGYKIMEVNRVLKEGGIFITQQVGGMNGNDLNIKLGYQNYQYNEWCLNKAIIEMNEVYLKIIKRLEDISKMRFFVIGAIIYYLKCIPWQIPNFDIEKSFGRIEELNKQIEIDGYLDILMHRFIIIAQKN
jgi:SAM-dependent methyltransferase